MATEHGLTRSGIDAPSCCLVPFHSTSPAEKMNVDENMAASTKGKETDEESVSEEEESEDEEVSQFQTWRRDVRQSLLPHPSLNSSLMRSLVLCC